MKKTGPKPGSSTQRIPEFQQAQATLIVERRLKGIPLDLIAKEFNLSEGAVQDRIRLAKKTKIVEEIKERVIQELLGPAVDALKRALEDGSVDAAKAVLFGTGVLLKNPVVTAPTAEMTLTEYRQRKAAKTLSETLTHEYSLQQRSLPAQLPDPDDGGREDQGDDPERE